MHLSDPSQINYTVGTLNYSCSIVSPYQFHDTPTKDENQFQYKFNEAFRHFALKEYPNFDDPQFEWGMRALDLVWKTRWSPFYDIKCGVDSHGKMMNEHQFIHQWNKHAKHQKKHVIEQGIQRLKLKGSKLTREQIIEQLQKEIGICLQFDLIGYKGLMKVLYGVQDIKHIDLSSDIYLSQRKKHFNKSYLNEQQKQKRTLQFIEDRGFDVFTIQQVNKRFIKLMKKQLKTYIVVEMPDKLSQICESVILLKKSKFPGETPQSIEEFRQKFLQSFALRRRTLERAKRQQKQSNQKMVDESEEQVDLQQLKLQIHKQLFWNNDTCYCIVGPLILFSPHISTKIDFNQAQINHIKSTITQIVTYFPKEYFICAGDLNGQFDNQINFKTQDNRYIKVNVFPTHEDDTTCYKMRTVTQAQKNKALEVSHSKKDYIITDLRIDDPAIMLADGTIVNKDNIPLIPNDRHPFDHFLVVGSIRLMERVISASPLLKKDRLSKSYDLNLGDQLF